MHTSISGQTRTPPALKWMLNERAAVAGEVSKADAQLQALEPKIAALERQLATIQASSRAAASRLAARQLTLAGLDASITLMYQEVRPDAAGVVNAWANRYGKRGGLQAFVLKAIQEAAPFPVNSKDMLLKVVAHFGISIVTPYDRRALRRSLKNTFCQLHRKGLIEPLHNRASTCAPGVWRWTQPTTLAGLTAKAAAVREAAADGNSRHLI